MTNTLRSAIRNVLQEAKIIWGSQRSRESFRKLRLLRGLNLHLGCGTDIRNGWVNIDIYVSNHFDKRTAVIFHDLRCGLPIADACCSYVYSSHFWEHLHYKDGIHLFRECYRALEIGGVFRIVLPDILGLVDAYRLGNDQHFELLHSLEESWQVTPYREPGLESSLDWVNFGCYQIGEHVCIYDFAKLEQILKKVGFSSVVASDFDCAIDIDDPVRKAYSLYVEAIK